VWPHCCCTLPSQLQSGWIGRTTPCDFSICCTSSNMILSSGVHDEQWTTEFSCHFCYFWFTDENNAFILMFNAPMLPYSFIRLTVSNLPSSKLGRQFVKERQSAGLVAEARRWTVSAVSDSATAAGARRPTTRNLTVKRPTTGNTTRKLCAGRRGNCRVLQWTTSITGPTDRQTHK